MRRFLKIYLIFLVVLGPEAHPASNKNEHQKHKNNNVSGSKALLVRRADNTSTRSKEVIGKIVAFFFLIKY
jgi:ABC-type tungstate transport system permease subunit